MGIANLPLGIYTASRQLISGLHINKLTDLLTSFQGAVVALAGGAQAGSPVLNGAFVEIVTVANANDSVQLPKAKVGLFVTVTNSGANSVQIFGNAATTDTINGTAGTVGVALAAAAVARFQCTKDGVWRRFVSS